MLQLLHEDQLVEAVLRLLLLGVLLGRTKTPEVQLEVVPSSFVSCPLSGVHPDVWVHRVLTEVALPQPWSSKVFVLQAFPLEAPTLSVVLWPERGMIEELVLLVLVLPKRGLAS